MTSSRRKSQPGRSLTAEAKARDTLASPPLRCVLLTARPVLDDHAQRKQRDHLDQSDEGVDCEPRESARYRKAYGTRVEALLSKPIELSVLSQNQTDRRSEHNHGPDDVA